jgi:hypothetical protein
MRIMVSTICEPLEVEDIDKTPRSNIEADGWNRALFWESDLACHYEGATLNEMGT